MPAIARVLAFSTISQIAFMMVALGVARPDIHDGMGYMAGMFHMFTHAMFKALLFLGAGALIHAVHSNDYTAMGGLRKYSEECQCGAIIENIQREQAGHKIHTGHDHGGGMNQGRYGSGTFHGVRQPYMKRHHGRFAHTTHEDEDQRKAEQRASHESGSLK